MRERRMLMSVGALMLLLVAVAAVGAEAIHLEGIIGAFLAGLAVNTATRHSEAKHELEFIGNHLFIPVFFLTIGFLIDIRTFANTLVEQFGLVFGIVGGLIGSKYLAAEVARRAFGYTRLEGLTMWSLSIPQVAATLAAALVAYNTTDAAGERLIGEPVLNSVIVAGLTTLFCLAIGALAAFSLSRLEVKGRFGILGVVLSVSMFPQIAIVGPLYLTASNYGFLDTYTGLVIVYLALGLPLVTWVLFGYFETLPREIDEAARMDGVSVPGLLWRIILPMSLPSLVTTGLLAFITAWNEFLFALAFTSNIDRQTIPVGIANFTNLYYVPWGDIAAASAVVTVPLILLVLFFQRHIIEGLTQGGVKE